MSSLKFNKDFFFGFSEAGFQFEMGLPGLEDPNTDWWQWVHSADNIASGVVSGDLPENGPGYLCLYNEDHEIASKLGANVLRVGLEWSRLFPSSTRDIYVDIERDDAGVISRIEIPQSSLNELMTRINKKAVESYRSLLRDWVDRGGKIILNLNHFTLPLWLHNPIEVRYRGVDRAPAGWLHEEAIIEFTKYAYIVSQLFSDLVDSWSTLNEPNVVALMGYLFTSSGFPPSIPSMEYAMLALKNMAIAHARAYDTLKEITRKPVGAIVNFMWIEPLNPEREEEKAIASQVSYFYNNIFIDTVTNGVSLLGASDSLRNKLDWIGVNYYTRMIVTGEPNKWKPVPGYGYLCQPRGISKDMRPCSDFGWEIYPEGLEKTLISLNERYRKPIIVTENGIADEYDYLRPRFILEHLVSTWRALSQGVDVKGYLHWSLIDNYEWAKGYSMKFGLVKVDLETKKRKLRPSALLFKEIATRKEIPEKLQYL